MDEIVRESMNKRKRVLITSFDLAIGGVERSLIGLLNQLDYGRYDVDLMLFKHEGEFFPLLPKGPNLLQEVNAYATFRKPIKQMLQEGNISIAFTRLVARYIGNSHGKYIKSEEPGYLVIQYGWKYSLPFLPKLHKEYDVAISFLWPHFFVGEKVRAKRKVGWIHTDYSKITLNKHLEQQMWGKIDHIVAVSNDCKDSFLQIFPSFRDKTEVIENIISPDFVLNQSKEDITDEMPINDSRVKIVTVGRLSYAKGIDDAAFACRNLLDQGYDIEWYIVGYGSMENKVKGLIHELNLHDRFKLLGKKTNPYPYIKASDIYVQPSRYEGKAVTVREAQILGKPVLITNFPTAKSQVRNEIDGLITPIGIEGIVTGITKLIKDKELKERLAANSLKSDYSNSSEIEKLYRLFDS